MAFVKVSAPRTSQPQDLCGIDFGNAYAKYLAGGAVVTGTAPCQSDIFGKPVSYVAFLSGALTRDVGTAGVSVRQNCTESTTVSYVSIPTPALNTRNFSFFAKIRIDAANEGAGAIGRLGTSNILLWRTSSGAYDLRINGTDYAATGTWPLGTWVEILITSTASGVSLYVNGLLVISGTVAAAGTTGVAFNFGDDPSGGGANGIQSWQQFLFFNKGFSAEESRGFLGNPWQIFELDEQWIWVSDAASAPVGPTGDLAATELGSDTAALSGQIVVQGTLAATESGTDTAAIQGGSSPVTGSLSATESGTDTSAISGIVVVAGTLAATESGTDTASIAAQLVVQGSLAVSESGSDTALINGSSVITTTGTISATESGADGCVSTGTLLVQGLLDAAESGTDTVYAPGQIYVIGALVATETGSDTCAIAGSSPVTITGMLDAVEIGADTCQILQSAITAVYPQPDQVLSGITYGPTGADYTGTATVGSFPSAIEIAAAVRADLSAELARIDAAISSRATVAAIMGATAP